MALISYYDIGFATVANGSTAVTGTSTQWLTALRENDVFVGADGRSARVASIESATSLTLARAWPGDSQTDDAYEVRITPAPSEITASVRELLEKLRQGLWLTPNATGTLAERAAFDSARRGFIYMQTDVDPFVVFVKQTDTEGDWSPGFSPQQGPSGPFTTIEIGTVTTLAPDQPATITPVQVGDVVTLNFGIPRGPTGDIDGVTPFWVTRLGSDANAAAARAGLDVPSNGELVAVATTLEDGIEAAKNRANHTGTQAISTIEGLEEAIGDRIGDVVKGWRPRAVAGRAFMGGGTSNTYAGTGGVSGGTGTGRTFVAGVASRGIRQDGYVRTFKINVSVNAGSTGTFKLKVLRPNGGSFDVLAQSDVINLGTGTGLKTFQLPVPLGPFAVGDRLGLFISGSAAGSAWSIAVNAANSALFREGDSTGGETYTSLADVDLLMWGECSSPMFLVTGDSIIEGHNTASIFHSSQHGGPSGNRNAEPFYKTLNDLPGLVDYQNVAQGGAAWDNIATSMAVLAPLIPHHSVVAHCGVNDIGTGRTWGQTERDMYAFLATLPAGTRLFVTEILPWTAGNDTQAALIRTFNANYAAWCALNGAFLIECHDAMGQVRGSTGQIDNLATAFDFDGVHLTQAGVDEFGRLIAEGIKAQIV